LSHKEDLAIQHFFENRKFPLSLFQEIKVMLSSYQQTNNMNILSLTLQSSPKRSTALSPFGFVHDINRIEMAFKMVV